MGCMVKIEMHEDELDAIIDLINIGLKQVDKRKRNHDELMVIYKEAIDTLKHSTQFVDVWDGRDRTKDRSFVWERIE